MNIQKSRKNLFIICCGAMLEYYDFIIFGLLAPYIAKNFFSQFSSPLALSYALFAIGYIFRPLGGAILGVISDLKGREKIFSFIAFLTGMSTMLMGCLPTNIDSDWPLYFLVLLRVSQSVGYGADIPNATTIIYENAPNNQKSSRLAFVLINATLGSLLAFLVMGVLTRYVNALEIYEYGWRIPLILGGVLTLMVFFARRVILLSSSFNRKNINNSGGNYISFLKFLLRDHVIELFVCFSITLSSSAFVITNIYLPNYLHEFFGFSKANIIQANTYGLLLCLGLLFLTGRYLNKYSGRKALLCIGTAVCLLLIYLIFTEGFHHISQIWLFVVISYIYNCFAVVYGLKVSMSLFRSANRNTAVAIIYNGAFVCASLLPNINIALNNFIETKISILYILLFIVACNMLLAKNFISKKGL